MKKINIIKSKREFEHMIKNHKYYTNKYFVIYINKKEEKYHRFGISIPKKVGNSVMRNKLKRQIKSILDNNINVNTCLDYVIITRKEILNLNYIDKKEDLDKLLQKINGAWKSEKI